MTKRQCDECEFYYPNEPKIPKRCYFDVDIVLMQAQSKSCEKYSNRLKAALKGLPNHTAPNVWEAVK